ncbi:MAG: DNA polymerase, partial [bacterium]|nr:DNA polymerase [bacterium]
GGVYPLPRAGMKPAPTPSDPVGVQQILTDASAIRAAVAAAHASSAVSLAVVADDDDPRRGHPRALGMAFAGRTVGIHPWGTALSESVGLLRDAAVAKDAHDAKSLLHALHRSRIELEGLRYDTEILSYLLAPGNRSHDLAHVAFAELGIEPPAPHPLTLPLPAGGGETKKNFSPSTEGEREGEGAARGDEQRAAAERAGREASIVASLIPILVRKVEDAGLTRVYEEFDRPLVPVLFRMEAIGVLLDVAALNKLGTSMRKDLERADRAITKLAGEEFNIDSPQQLKRILFEKLGLAVVGIKKTAKGKTLSTAAAELEKLRGSHAIIEHLLTHRELQKLLSTYVDALPALVDPTDGRVHTTYHQTVAATGRLSSSQPNLQNIPAAEPWGPKIRSAFVAEPGWKLLAFDYSQFELRVAATLSGDRALQRAFRAGHDIHAATGAEVFGVAPEEVTKDQRRVAKAIN